MSTRTRTEPKPCTHCSELECTCTPEEKFIRLANKRTEKFDHQCKLLRNLATSYAYKMNHELANDLLVHYTKELETVRVTWLAEMEKETEKERLEAAVEVEVEAVTS